MIDAFSSAASSLDDRNSDGRYRNCSIVDTLVRWMVVPPSSSSVGGAALPPPGNVGEDGDDDDAAAGGGRGCGIKRLGWGRTRGGSGGRGGVDDGSAIGTDVNLNGANAPQNENTLKLLYQVLCRNSPIITSFSKKIE